MRQFDLQTWFPDAVRYFRAFGFFASSLRSEEVEQAIQSYWGGDWKEFLAGVSGQAGADQWLLVVDTQRVWWHDLEGVYRGANYYIEVLKEWAVISRGQFAPEQVEETWQGDDGPVEIRFTLNGSRLTFVHRSGDFLDHGILRLINQALPDTSFRFEVATDYGDSNWIAMLSQDEKQRLTTDRGWQFL